MKLVFVVIGAVLFLAGLTGCSASHFQSNRSVVKVPEKIDAGDRFANSEVGEKDRPDSVPARPSEDNSDSSEESALKTSGTADALVTLINRRILKNAEYVVAKEKNIRGVGDACNFYVQRVLDLSGFSDQGYLANDFDDYAKDRFKNHKTAFFQVEPRRKDTKALHSFLYSYPEETPFILQWEKKVGSGHLAIVTRKGDKLIIYEASLGRFRAEKKITTARTILSASDRYKLTVYVDFMPSDK